MGDIGLPIAVGAAFIGLVFGYFAGYRSGTVAGELEALKSSLRHDRGKRHQSSQHSQRPEGRPAPEAPSHGRFGGE